MVRRVRPVLGGVVLVALVSAVAVQSSSARPRAAAPQPKAVAPVDVLVTNDDGVGAPGIDAVVQALRVIPGIRVTVVAPATNQSGTGDSFSTTPVTVTQTTTASGYPATAVAGYPADAVLYGVFKVVRPKIVVSGANLGQNIADAVYVSGTVGAARTASRLGIPSIAVSAGFAGTVDYTTPARYAATLVAYFAPQLATAPPSTTAAKIINVNTPSCTTGSVRGAVLVPVGRATRVTGYTDLGGGQFQPVVDQRNILASDCTSTATNPTDDLDAFNNGFAAVSLLDADL